MRENSKIFLKKRILQAKPAGRFRVGPLCWNEIQLESFYTAKRRMVLSIFSRFLQEVVCCSLKAFLSVDY
jgi:hypothetical protein